MMGTEIFNIDASWAEKLTKTRVSFSAAPTCQAMSRHLCAANVEHQGPDARGEVLGEAQPPPGGHPRLQGGAGPGDNV